MAVPVELELPLGIPDPGSPFPSRMEHLRRLPGVDEQAALRLTRAFPNLSSIYGASEQQLAKVVGPVVAARVRWFLEAPLSGSSSGPPDAPLLRVA